MHFFNLILLLIVSQLPEFLVAQIQSSTFKQLSNSSATLCATDPATTVSQARSLIDCQLRCTKNNCFVSNFYTDTKTCEVYNFKPTTFTTSRKTCTSFRNSNNWPDYQDCLIQAVAWGFNDAVMFNGYISINNTKVWDTPLNYVPGFTTFQLNPSSCTTSNQRIYNTWGSGTDSENMATYINNLPVSTVLIGVTNDEPVSSLTANAKNALAGIGVDVTALSYRGKVAFVAVKGRPEMSVSALAGAGGNSVMINVITRVYLLEANIALIRQ